MPNVTIYAPAAHFKAGEAAYEGFLRECTEACTGILQAELDKVHIIFVPALEQCAGQDAYIEVKVRANAQRTPLVMEEYLKAVEVVFRRHFDCLPRIRCFTYDEDRIFARN